jgi:hypothetical protein
MVTFQFEGRLTSVDSELTSEFAVGDKFTGTYTFNPNVPPDDPDLAELVGTFTFANAVSAMSFTSGNYNISSVANGSIINDFQDDDLYQAAISPVSGTSIGDYAPRSMSLSWIIGGNSVASLDPLDFPGATMLINPNFDPNLPPEVFNSERELFDTQGNIVYDPLVGVVGDLNQPLFDRFGNQILRDENGDFIENSRGFSFDFATEDQQSAFISGDLTSVTAAVVPIPAAVWLFGTGLLGLVGFTKRKQSS